MKIKERKIEQLKQAEYNPRKITSKQLSQLEQSLEKFGFVEPVIVNMNDERKNILISGHQRVRAATILGYEKVPVLELDLTLEEEKELNIRMNKNGGEFKFDMLESHFELDDLFEWGFDGTDFDLESIADEMLEDIPESTKKDEKRCPHCDGKI